MNPLDLRSSVIIFVGEDVFPPPQSNFEASFGRYAPVHRILYLSTQLDTREWTDSLRDAFEVFTAISISDLCHKGLLIRDEVDVVPIVIVASSDSTRYSELITAVVECAAASGLVGKLQFVTVAALDRIEDLTERSHAFHSVLESVDDTPVRLETGVVGICDYWRGTRIGSSKQLMATVARIVMLLTLSETKLLEGHLGQFRNGMIGGKTFCVGLAIYSAPKLETWSQQIYGNTVRTRIERLLSNNSAQIDHTGNFYTSILEDVRPLLQNSILDPASPEALQLRTRYEGELVPLIMSSLCSKVRNLQELLLLTESLAERLRARSSPSQALVLHAFPLALLIEERSLIFSAIALLALAGTGFVAWRKTQAPRSAFEEQNVREASGKPVMVVPSDPVLAEVLDDFARELKPKINSSAELWPDERVPVGNPLLCERIFRPDEQTKAVINQVAEKAVDTSAKELLLLLLGASKWAKGDELVKLIQIQRNAISEIESSLRAAFAKWAVDSEQHRDLDGIFVQEVLYAPPPPNNAPVHRFCLAPQATQQLPVIFDRAALKDCPDTFTFLYLVEQQ